MERLFLISSESNPWMPSHVHTQEGENLEGKNVSLPKLTTSSGVFTPAVIYHSRTQTLFRTWLREATVTDRHGWRNITEVHTLYGDVEIKIPDAAMYKPVKSRFHCPRRSHYHKSFYVSWTLAAWKALPEYPYFYQDYLLGKLEAFVADSRRSSFSDKFTNTSTLSNKELGLQLWPYHSTLLTNDREDLLPTLITSFINDPQYEPWDKLTPILRKGMEYADFTMPALAQLNEKHLLRSPCRISQIVTKHFQDSDNFLKRVAFYKNYFQQPVTLQLKDSCISTNLATLALLDIVTKSQYGQWKETERCRFNLMLDTMLEHGANPHQALAIFCSDSSYSWNRYGLHYLVSLGARLGEEFFNLIDTAEASAHEALEGYNKLEALLSELESKKVVD